MRHQVKGSVLEVELDSKSGVGASAIGNIPGRLLSVQVAGAPSG